MALISLVLVYKGSFTPTLTLPHKGGGKYHYIKYFRRDAWHASLENMFLE